MRLIPLVPVLLLAVAAGCSHVKKDSGSKAWPQKWADRQLYQSPNACIYASSARAANEAQRRIAKVAADFDRIAGGGAAGVSGRGLVIVIDADEASVPALDPRLLVQQAVGPELSGTPDGDEQWSALNRAAEALGLNIDQLISFLAWGMPPQKMCDLAQLPADSAAISDLRWAVMMPSDGRIRQINKAILQHVIERSEVSPAKRVLVNLMMPAVEPAMIDAIASANGVVVFEQMAVSQTDWDDARRADVIRRYNNETSNNDPLGFAADGP